MKEYSCYLFDADGTLIDTTEMICRCFENTYSTFAKKQQVPSRSEVIAYIGLPLRKQIEHFLGPLTDEQYAPILQTHMDFQMSICMDYVKTFPGIPEALAKLAQKGKKMAVVTSRRLESLTTYLTMCGIVEYFDHLITPELTNHHKPHPEPALLACKKCGVAPERTIFIGDAFFDIECGTAAGMDTAFVGWSYNDPQTLAVKPTWIVHDPKELLWEDD